MGLNEEKDSLKNREIALANKNAVLALTILCSIISAAYILEILKHTRTVSYVLMVVAFAMIPVALAQIDFKSDNASLRTRYIVVVGFLLLYAIVLFTTENILNQ